jgi:hypothetical protein
MSTQKSAVLVTYVFLCIGTVSGNPVAAEDKPWWECIEGQLAAGKPEFIDGEPIFVKITLTNHTGEVISVWDALYHSFEFSVPGSVGVSSDKLRRPDISGLFRTVPLPSETSFHDVAFVSEYLNLHGSGVYTVACRGDVLVRKGSAKNGGADTQWIVVASTVTVKIRKGSGKELESTLRDYLKQLQSSDRALQRQGARALAASEPILAVKLLKEALTRDAIPDPLGVMHAAWALGRIGTEDAIQALTDTALHSPSNKVRVPLIIELGRSRIVAAVPALTEMLSDSSPDIRVAALNALGKIARKETGPAIEAKLNDPDPRVRGVAAQVYQKLRAQEGREPGPNRGN